MNQNELFLLLHYFAMAFALMTLIYWQHKRIRELEVSKNDILLQWFTWSSAKQEDYPSARMMASLARQKQSAGAPLLTEHILGEDAKKENPKKEIFTIKQSAV